MERWTKYAALWVVAAGMLAYANSFSGAFVLDDARCITGNPDVRRLWPSDRGGWLRSRGLVGLTFSLNYAVGGLKEADYHAVNLAFHLGCALLLFGVVRRTLARARPDVPAARATEAAAVAACLWVAHPLTTSSVTYLSQRYEVMASFFYLLTVYGLVRDRTGWYAVSAVSCALGMWCKEVVVTAPVLAAVFDRTYLATSWREIWRRRKWLYAAYAATYGFVLYLMSRVAEDTGRAEATFVQGFSWTYALTQAQVVTHYLRLALWPYPLCLDYGWPLVQGFREALPALAVLVPVLVASAFAVWRAPRGGYLAVWFFGILAPTSSVLFRPDCALEYRMYLPLAAACTAAALGLQALLAEAWERRFPGRAGAGAALRAGVSAALVAVLVVVTLARNRVYASAESVWRDVAARRPNNLKAVSALASAVLARGDVAEAERLARSLVARMESLPDAERHPYLPAAYNRLGSVLICSGKWDEAEKYLQRAIERRPVFAAARYNRALLWASRRRPEEDVLSELDAAMRDDPRYVQAYVLAGDILARRGDDERAVSRYREALKLDPDRVGAQCALAWLLATSAEDKVRDGKAAVALAVAACESLQGRSARAWDVLGAAYAEAGRFRDAEQAAGHGVSLLAEIKAADPCPWPWPYNRQAMEKEMRGRLDLYRQGKPFRRIPAERPTPAADTAGAVGSRGP